MYYHDPFTVVASFLPPAILVCLVVQLVLYCSALPDYMPWQTIPA